MISRLAPIGLVGLVSFVGCAKGAPAAAPPLSRADGDAAWALLSGRLPGAWTLVRDGGDAGARAPFVVAYRLVSNGTALVEVWGAGSAHETETVFHRDGSDVLLTHYCAQGNQPRLRAASAGADVVSFRFVDVTDRGPDEAVLVERSLHLGADALEDTEVYRGPDGATERTVYRFVRTAPR